MDFANASIALMNGQHIKRKIWETDTGRMGMANSTLYLTFDPANTDITNLPNININLERTIDPNQPPETIVIQWVLSKPALFANDWIVVENVSSNT